MHIKPHIGSVVGPASSTHWGQVLLLPEGYGVVEVAFEDGAARAFGIHLLSVLSQKVSRGLTSLKEIQDIVDESIEEGVQTILLCIPVGGVVYLVVGGTGDVYLKRGHEFARLLHGSGAISGEVKIGDTLLLASKEFSKALTQEEFARVFDDLPPQEIAERLTLLLHEKAYGEGSAALILQIDDETFPQEEVVISKQDKPVLPQRASVNIAAPVLSRLKPRLLALRRYLSLIYIKEFVKSLKSHPKKMTATITIFLVLLFGVSVLLGLIKQSTQNNNQSVAGILSDAKHALDEGVALQSLNPVKGRERLVQAKALLAPLRTSVNARSAEGRQVADLYREVTDNLTQAMQINKVKPELYFDVSLVKKDGAIASLGIEDTTMGFVDEVTRTVYALNILSKNVQVLGGGQTYTGLSSVALHGDKLYVLTDAGIHMVRQADKQTVQSIVKKDDAWGRVGSLVSFGGNLYLLDTTKSRIWKYVATETGFSELREYLNPDTLPDLSRATSMAIDGSVWMGTMDGKIVRFTQGKENTYIPKGVDPAFGTTLVVYTSDATKNLYVLDSQNKRVVVLDKDGIYLAQYVWEGDFHPTNLVVSEDPGKKIYLLAAGKLYAIGLK